MEYYIVLLVFYAITLIFLRLVFAEIEGRQARKMSNVRYFLRYHSKFVYRNQFSIIFVAFLCYMIVSVEKAFSTMWFLQLLGFIAVGVISDALSQIVSTLLTENFTLLEPSRFLYFFKYISTQICRKIYRCLYCEISPQHSTSHHKDRCQDHGAADQGDKPDSPGFISSLSTAIVYNDRHKFG